MNIDTRHWSLQVDHEKLAWLELDFADGRNNILSTEVIQELATVVDALEQAITEDQISGLICLSGKSSGFAYGANVAEFDHLGEVSEVQGLINNVHDLFDRLEALKVPTAVGIDGFCLGGGLELALCFDYRVGVRNRTRVGFPEIRLGLFPGFAGTARSVREMGGFNALSLMLAGAPIKANKARAQNLLQATVDDPGQLRWACRKAVLAAKKSKAPGWVAELSNLPGVRHGLAAMMRKKVAAKVNPDHYPAPNRLIDNWVEGGGDFDALKALEVEHFPRLMVGSCSRNLRRVFFLSEALKRQAKGKSTAKHIHVIGAGVMGGDIAAWCAANGFYVSLQDLDAGQIEIARKRAKKILKRKLKSDILAKNALLGLVADVDGKGIARADVIIEAAVERLDIKQSIFAKVEAEAKPSAIIATNTSAIPLEDIASAMQDPSRLVGIHFFNPVASLPLVEVVYSTHSGQAAIDGALQLVKSLGKYPVLVKSSPGFLVNRCLTSYMFKALDMHHNGESMAKLDQAALDFGMPMGPFELMDQVGLDIAASVGQSLGYADAEASVLLRSRIDAKQLGKKSGQGFYLWQKGKAQRESVEIADSELKNLAAQLMQPLIDEAKACVEQEVVADSDLADAGLIFGTGFAPFRGGPIHYANTEQST